MLKKERGGAEKKRKRNVYKMWWVLYNKKKTYRYIYIPFRVLVYFPFGNVSSVLHVPFEQRCKRGVMV